MTDRPIIFSGPMVKALIAGSKFQTRRVIKPQPEDVGLWMAEGNKPRYAVGDRLWCRETLRFDWKSSDWQYDADRAICVDVVGTELETPTPERWPVGVCSSIHMPRVLSRLTLTVTEVRVQRLQEISEEDAKAEGCGMYISGHGFITLYELRADPGFRQSQMHRQGFEATWLSLHGDGSWAENPWVVALTFGVEQRNIDDMKEAA